MRKGVKHLPDPIKHPILRRSFRLPKEISEELSISVVQTPQEMESALRVLHDAYVDFGYMNPHPSGLRVLPQHAMLTTTMIVVKIADEVIGTVSMILDNPLGLPMDSIFDLSPYRQNGMRLMEVSSLAVAKKYRFVRGKIFLPVCKFALEYAQRFSVADYMVIAVNPKVADFYRAIVLFDKLPTGAVKNYDFVKGAPAVGQIISIADLKKTWANVYDGVSSKRNFLEFMNEDLDQLKFPIRQYRHGLENVLSQGLFRDLFIEKTKVLEQLPMEKKVRLARYYSGSQFEADILQACGNLLPFNARSEFRYETLCSARVGVDDSKASVLSVSRGGLHLRFLPGKGPVVEGERKLQIEVAPNKIAQTVGETVWLQPGQAGLKIIDHDATWSEYLEHLDEYVGNSPKRRPKAADGTT